MSTRTILEINHDQLRQLADHPEDLAMFVRMLGLSLRSAEQYRPNGIKILAQRHHSTALTITVK